MSSLLKEINWGKDDLIPAIIQDEKTKEVLMLAYMNIESLELTINTNIVHFFSRSKNRIWKKGESSGHIQNVKKVILDCDKDTVLILVEQSGVACHTGSYSCFFNDIINNVKINNIKDINVEEVYNVIDILFNTIKDRKKSSIDKSYTSLLFSKGENEILKKVIEENGEFVFAYKDNDKKEIIYEVSDLIYHILVALVYKDISIDEVRFELKRRFNKSGIEEKKNRKSE
jgi:phosphoribosyl-ATP pyrophosphohydrolase/phosphoribosyl-AMP cyclohydrolase